MMIKCRKTTVVGIILGLCLLIGASSLNAHFGASQGANFGNPQEHITMMSLYLTKKLDLDTSQQQELDAIAQQLLQKGKALHELQMNTREEVLSMLKAGTVDAQRIQLLQNQHKGTISDFITEAGSRLIEFVSMLSHEQRQRLAELIEDHADGCPVH